MNIKAHYLYSWLGYLHETLVNKNSTADSKKVSSFHCWSSTCYLLFILYFLKIVMYIHIIGACSCYHRKRIQWNTNILNIKTNFISSLLEIHSEKQISCKSTITLFFSVCRYLLPNAVINIEWEILFLNVDHLEPNIQTSF